jgi:hypothetical protein
MNCSIKKLCDDMIKITHWGFYENLGVRLGGSVCFDFSENLCDGCPKSHRFETRTYLCDLRAQITCVTGTLKIHM